MMEPSRITKGWFTTEHSGRLSGRTAKNTRPEMLLRRKLHSLGLRYRVQYKLASRVRVDVAFPSKAVAIWVDGCFWHGCPEHGRSTFNGPNASRWKEKMDKNRQRDSRAVALALDLGWKPIRVWECDIQDRPDETLTRILALLRSSET